MGKGDQKTRKGKIFAGSYGVRRKKNKRKNKHIPASRPGVTEVKVAVPEIVSKPEPIIDPVPVPQEAVAEPVEGQEKEKTVEEPKKKVVRKKPAEKAAVKKEAEPEAEVQAE